MSRWRAVVGQGTRFERSGLVHIGFAGGHFGMRRFAVGGLAGRGGCHTLVTSGAKRGGTERRYAETISAGRREGRDGLGRVNHGFSLTGGQVVAGSNPVSPTKFRQVKCYFYLLPKPARPVHLIRCRRRPGIAVSLPGAKPALTCVFCPKCDARMAARSSRRVVTRKSVDGGRASRSHPETSR